MSPTVTNSTQFVHSAAGTSSDAEGGGLDLIEQVQKTTCTNALSPLLQGVNPATKRAALYHPRCKLWGCPVCGEINRKLWAYKAQHGASVLQEQNPDIPLQFVCLTSHEKLSPVASISVLPSAWKKIRMRAGYASGLELAYFAVPERHKSGKLHLHAIVRTDLPERWWKDVPRACGMGYMNDAGELTGTTPAALYVSKYLGKTLAEENWKKYHRRVRKSNNWPSLPEQGGLSDLVFEVVPKEVSVQVAYMRLIRQGYHVEILDHASAWTHLENPDAVAEGVTNA